LLEFKIGLNTCWSNANISSVHLFRMGI
jgi:hypothetical protein